MGAEVLLAINNVAMSYDDTKQPLFENVDLKLCRGEVVGVIGQNGAGKTTLLNLCTGFLKPSSGHIIFGGKILENNKGTHQALYINRSFQHIPDQVELPLWRYIQPESLNSMLQLKSFWQWCFRIIVEPFKVLFSRSYHEYDDKLRYDCRLMFKKLGLDPILSETSYLQASMGVKRISDVLRALNCSASICILDEPFSNLNIHTAEKLAELIKERVKHLEIACLICDHNTSFVNAVATNIYLLTASGLERQTENLNQVTIKDINNTINEEFGFDIRDRMK